MVGSITFYDFCSFWSVAVNITDKLLYFLYLFEDSDDHHSLATVEVV